MAKVKFSVDNGANIHSCRESGWLDTVDDLGLGEHEWEGLSEDERYEFVQDWADKYIEIYYEESEEC